jgi:hypothetical protein
MFSATSVTLASMTLTRAFVRDVRERARRSVPMPRTQADRVADKRAYAGGPCFDFSAPTSNGSRFSGADRAPRPWLLEHSKAAVRVRCNRLVGRSRRRASNGTADGERRVTSAAKVSVCGSRGERRQRHEGSESDWVEGERGDDLVRNELLDASSLRDVQRLCAQPREPPARE